MSSSPSIPTSMKSSKSVANSHGDMTSRSLTSNSTPYSISTITSSNRIRSAISNLINISSPIPQLMGMEYYFYFVNESTMLPIVLDRDTDSYPIKITTPGLLIPKILPLLTLSLKAIKICNGITGIVRCCGYPIPTIPKSLLKNADKYLNNLDKKSSISDYDSLQRCIDGLPMNNNTMNSSSDQIKKLRGEPLKQLEEFLLLNGGNKVWESIGLNRYLSNDGTVCWMTNEDYERMQYEAKSDVEVDTEVDTRVTKGTEHPTTLTTSSVMKYGHDMSNSIVGNEFWNQLKVEMSSISVHCNASNSDENTYKNAQDTALSTSLITIPANKDMESIFTSQATILENQVNTSVNKLIRTELSTILHTKTKIENLSHNIMSSAYDDTKEAVQVRFYNIL